MRWLFISSTDIWVTSSDSGSVTSRARTELTSSKCDWTRNLSYLECRWNNPIWVSNYFNSCFSPDKCKQKSRDDYNLVLCYAALFPEQNIRLFTKYMSKILWFVRLSVMLCYAGLWKWAKSYVCSAYDRLCWYYLWVKSYDPLWNWPCPYFKMLKTMI